MFIILVHLMSAFGIFFTKFTMQKLSFFYFYYPNHPCDNKMSKIVPPINGSNTTFETLHKFSLTAVSKKKKSTDFTITLYWE